MSSAGITSVWTANRKVCIRISASALPAGTLQWMDEHVEELEAVVHRHRPSTVFAPSTAEPTLEACLQEISQQFDSMLRNGDGGDALLTGSLCGLSVARGGRAVLLDASGSGWALGEAHSADAGVEPVPLWMRPSVLAGFHLAASAGPLCEEPMRGVALVLHGCQVHGLDEAIAPPAAAPADAAASAPVAVAAASGPYGPMSGQVMVATKEACRCCLFRRGFARISEAMLSCELQCEQHMLESACSTRQAARQCRG